MNTENKKDLIVRFFEQDVTQEEKEKIQNLLQEDVEFLKEWREYRQIFLAMDLVAGFEKYGASHFDTFYIKSRKRKPVEKLFFIYNYSVLFGLAASIVLILSFLGFRFINSQYLNPKKLYAQEGKVIKPAAFQNYETKTNNPQEKQIPSIKDGEKKIKDTSIQQGHELKGSQLNTEGGISRYMEENKVRDFNIEDMVAMRSNHNTYSSIPLYAIHFSDTVYTEFSISWENKYKDDIYVLRVFDDKIRLMNEYIIDTEEDICKKTIEIDQTVTPPGQYIWKLYHRVDNDEYSQKRIEAGIFYVASKDI